MSRQKLFDVAASLLLALMAILAGGAALRESPTVDEIAHVGAGVSYLQKLDLRLNEEHPPLAKIIAAIPLALDGTRADYSQTSWSASRDYFTSFLGEWVFGDWLLLHWNNPVTTLALARLPMLLLTLLLGWMIFAYARRLGGGWAGLLCLATFVTAPVFLSTGPLVLTDLAVTLFSVIALWRMAQLWSDPSRSNVAWFALALAAALLSKFTAGLLFFAFIAFILTTRWYPVAEQPAERAEARLWRRRRWRAMWRGTLWAALAVYAVYLVFSWNQPTNAVSLVSAGALTEPIRRLLMPAWLYLRGALFAVLTSSRVTFVLGRRYPHGVWFYFPVVFALKSMLGCLALLLLAATAAFLAKLRKPRNAPAIPDSLTAHWRILWVSLIVIGGVCLMSRMNIGLRHFELPIVLAILLLAPLPRLLKRLPAPVARVGAAAAVIAAASCISVAVRAWPYYFPYVNALGLGRPAYTLINDSNVDWNQSLLEVRRFAEQRGLSEVPLDNYGFSDTAPYAPQARFWNCQAPAPAEAGKWVVVSANMILDGHNCPWLMRYPHQTLAAGSMYAVHLPDPIPPAGSTAGPPLARDFHEFGGGPATGMDSRLIFLGVVHDPNSLPAVMADMMERYRRYREARR
jgi:Dolichyl-phosphate-mannose-protein mannosyltransferase